MLGEKMSSNVGAVVLRKTAGDMCYAKLTGKMQTTSLWSSPSYRCFLESVWMKPVVAWVSQVGSML